MLSVYNLLHLLVTDICDKFSNASSTFLSINARLGLGVSKDSLRRYITNRCGQLEQQQRFLTSDSKDKSGFHGTTIQAVTPCPSLLTSISSAESGLDDSAVPLLVGGISSEASVITSDIDSSSCEVDLISSAVAFVDKVSTCTELSRDRSLTCDFIQSIIQIPGIKTFLSIPSEKTEKSDFTSVAVLDDTADKKETVLKVLNILHDKFEIGKSCNYIVVVGDGKSYDHLIKLKSEYGANLSWVLPYPGDWHILKNLLPIFMKVYLDAGLKQLVSKLHHGSTYRILTDCTKFAVTHRFLLQVWEALLRYQVNSFLTVSDKIIDCKTSFEHILDDIFSSLNLNSVDEANNCNIDSLWTEICSKKIEIFSAFSNDLLSEFRNWRYEQSSKSDTFSFWDSFIHTDFMNYLGFYVAIRTRNWELRNACLKQLACLFHAFDRHNYLRMIPYHLADLQNFPPDVLDFFQKRCFSVSISGENYFSVALDEAHEMQINLKTKNALNSFSQSSLATLTYYLPYRAETLDNLKTQLGFNRDSPHHTEMTVPYVQLQERNIDEYFSQLEHSTLYISDDKKNLFWTLMQQTNTASSKKAPPRRRRNLITVSAPKVTVSKQKKEIKDQKTVISCLRKKIAFSKFTNKAVSDLDQFLQLPRAICDADGIPEKDGMFIINTIPLSVHKTFLDYAGFLFDKWVVRPHFQFKATEVHLVFDHPNRQGTSPKDIERSRRDITDQTVEFDQLSPDTDLPSNWRSFLSVRKQKRLLVNFILDQFLTFANQKFSNSECSFITAGRFDNQFKD
ncbi:unnamed protein product [Mytilus coruscus]|uniref:DUF6589 domain-containing protein n=1 Tax=Mytilus coruscus TaxID=42192 RepID=A0A6J8AVL5_MYTCO|nr:unnamed protein product [Mytilus coruscus]